MSETKLPRTVPGAPPPTPLSKTQRKKNSQKRLKDKPVETIPDAASATVIEPTPVPQEIREGAIASELIACDHSQAPPVPEEEVLLKGSPIVDLIYKRLKATTKKIGRITIYASTDPDKLNDDQKRTLKTLPALEAVQKELSEVKKAVETHESELAHELLIKRVEADNAEKIRIGEAVAAAEASLSSKTLVILNIIRLRSLIATGGPDASAFANESEASAFVSFANALVGDDEEKKQATLSGFLFGIGNDDFDGISYSRLVEVSNGLINPPLTPTTVPEDVGEQPEENTTTPSLAVETELELEEPVPVVSGSLTTSSNFHFMQESELEPSSAFEDGAEWVEHPVSSSQDDIVTQETVVNGLSAPNAGDVSTVIDWSAETAEDESLPSIATWKSKFEPPTSVWAAPSAPVAPPAVNGIHPEHVAATHQHQEDDGFTQARGGRGRARGGRGGERSFRGGERGAFRGERGAFRGGRGGDRGAFRGGERHGDREGFRGNGDREGGFRSNGDRGRGGGWRSNGNGERLRGRGRGGGNPLAAAALAA